MKAAFAENLARPIPRSRPPVRPLGSKEIKVQERFTIPAITVSRSRSICRQNSRSTRSPRSGTATKGRSACQPSFQDSPQILVLADGLWAHSMRPTGMTEPFQRRCAAPEHQLQEVHRCKSASSWPSTASIILAYSRITTAPTWRSRPIPASRSTRGALWKDRLRGENMKKQKMLRFMSGMLGIFLLVASSFALVNAQAPQGGQPRGGGAAGETGRGPAVPERACRCRESPNAVRSTT